MNTTVLGRTSNAAVHPGFQARGIGVLRIDTDPENAATQCLFPKLGYVFAGELTLGFRPGLRFLGYEKRLV